ncbi:hypothetical protein WOLCODRAFT_113862 [Wolfiporia cocos MD-104 SS10]|uniref:Vacuolar membrane-associated protein IML1 n=1 Tax=Wolfiporia cocos (strain MD-104) TaxID=742152 RepID=A0A2H3J5V6_WOLCO|nr:hypothetical protein WOLCODRAFT_113862 [Wolfiporia cocos MD-104 SS10]
MSSSRAESQAPQYARRRSNTAQSVYKAQPLSSTPVRVGDSKSLVTWVHDPKESPNVKLNYAWWPGVAEGDVIRLSGSSDQTSGFLFCVQKDEGPVKYQLQVSIPRPVADLFGLRNNGEVILTKVDKNEYSASYVDLSFQDQYLGRNEMWRLSSHLFGQCVYVEQEISFIGVIAAKVQAIYNTKGSKVSTAYVTASTKIVYRSLSTKIIIFIQVCRELWEFAGDGERYNEKIVHSFLPALFAKWRDASTNHIVTIVLISRVFYDESETGYAAGPLRQDDEGRWYKDFFKVITDLEVLYDWKSTLVDLKNSFLAFQRDILLAHHYHRATLASPTALEPEHVRLVGRLSYAHDGPLLEALNLTLNPTETHYIDRSLSLTGSSTIIITPGTGYFRVSKDLLRLTTTRLLDQGFALELVSLAKPPLHQSPIFSFQGVEPEALIDTAKLGPRSLDPLWGGNDSSLRILDRMTTFWWEPFWMTISFWDRQMDLPFRANRFVARAKMHEIEMLGLLDHDVLSNIEVPFLTEPPSLAGVTSEHKIISPEDADKFDMDIFAPPMDLRPLGASRGSLTLTRSSMSSLASSRFGDGLRQSNSNRTSDTSLLSLVEESPQRVGLELAPEASATSIEHRLLTVSNILSTSPSQSSIHSVRSNKSQASTLSANTTTGRSPRSSRHSSSTPRPIGASAVSRFAPSWLLSPFRRELSQPQTSTVSVSVSKSSIDMAPEPPPHRTGPSNPSTAPIAARVSQLRSPPQMYAVPHTIRGSSSDEATPMSHDGYLHRSSPRNTPPRDDSTFGRRRLASGSKASIASSIVPPAPSLRTNPSKPLPTLPYTQSSLARRWQHIFPQPLSKHDIKWKAMVTPGCLPLTIEHFPSNSELETEYDVFSYEFVVDPPEMRSFLVRPPNVSGNTEEVRSAWALVVMRGMVAQRLAQGFQIVIRPKKGEEQEPAMPATLRRTRSYVSEDEAASMPIGVEDSLKSPRDPIHLSMSNEIHRIAYSGDTIQVKRYVRRMPRLHSPEYKCLIWPKLGVGYTELSTSFVTHGLQSYGWNRLDMLVAGYENQFSESIRYWRTRFVVIPADEPPLFTVTGPMGEKLNDEEMRLLGMDKLAELFSRARWCPPEDQGKLAPTIRFLTTDLEPSACVLDESLTAQLEEVHAAGPLRKKPKNDRDIADMSLASIAKAMREDDGVPIKDHKWHERRYPNSFTGAEFVSWLVREFRDVSTREQAVEWGKNLQEQGLFDHCRGAHGFLDGHYFYALKGEYLIPMTPRGGWFRSARHAAGDENTSRIGYYPSSVERISISGKRAKKRLILSQSMVIDIDPNKRSDQAESVILDHDIIHNPATCFHFELQWMGTTARCIDDLLRQWSRTIERYGLKLVETYVSQICDIRDRNPFQSCYPITLALAPPDVLDLDRRVPEGLQSRHYFESAILRKYGFVLDIEATTHYPEQVDVVYSYRHSAFKYSQWVHRSGVAFVQVLGGADGFLFLNNRLMAPGRLGTTLKSQRPAEAAEQIRIRLQLFCSDAELLKRFYDEETSQLEHVPEEPPPLHI